MMPGVQHFRNDRTEMSRFTRFGRVTAQLILAVLVLTAALSGSLRYCFGQNGHRAIEWVHGEKLEHIKQHTPALANISIVATAFRSTEPSCIDHLIFSETVRLDSPAATCKPPQPRHVPFADMGREHSWRAGILWPQFPSRPFDYKSVRDPALASLRTIVLLN
jgi:hypothetical protein